MNLELNNEIIETELNKCATEAISKAFGSYEIQSAIKKDVAERVVKDGLVKALAASVDKLDIDRITEALATEMQRTITKIVVVTVRASAANMLYQLRHGGKYVEDADRNRFMAEIKAEIGGAHD